MRAVRAEGRRGAALPLVPTDDTGAAAPDLGPVVAVTDSGADPPTRVAAHIADIALSS